MVYDGDDGDTNIRVKFMACSSIEDATFWRRYSG